MSDWHFCKAALTSLLSLGFRPSHPGAADLMAQIDSSRWSKRDADRLKGMAMRLLDPRTEREVEAVKGIVAVLNLYSHA